MKIPFYKLDSVSFETPVILSGNDAGVIEYTKNYLIERYFCEHERTIKTYDFNTLKQQELSDIIAEKGLFSNKKCVALNNIGANLLKWIDNPISDTLIIGTTTKSATGKKFETSPLFQVIPCYKLEGPSKISWIKQQLDGYPCDNNTVQTLGTILDGHLGVMAQEINKLKTFVGYGNPITAQNALKCCDIVHDDMTDQFITAVFTGQISLMERSVRLAKSWQYLLILLINEYKKLWELKSFMNQGLGFDTACKKTSPPIFWKSKDLYQKKIQSLNDNQLALEMESIHKLIVASRSTPHFNQTHVLWHIQSLIALSKR